MSKILKLYVELLLTLNTNYGPPRGPGQTGGCLQVAIVEFLDFCKKVLILVRICIMWPSKDFQNLAVNPKI